MNIVTVFCLLFFTAPAYGQDNANDLYSIDAEQIVHDAETNTITYKGNARVIVSNLIIEADSISIVKHLSGLPSKIMASGDPIRFQEKKPKNNINGTAREVTFVVAELKLTLTDYSITDPKGNNMKGKKASFILAP